MDLLGLFRLLHVWELLLHVLEFQLLLLLLLLDFEGVLVIDPLGFLLQLLLDLNFRFFLNPFLLQLRLFNLLLRITLAWVFLDHDVDLVQGLVEEVCRHVQEEVEVEEVVLVLFVLLLELLNDY